MGKEFAKIKGIGPILFRTVYGFYDGPLLFSCESLTGTLFLLLRLEGEMGRWLMVSPSASRLDALENNVLTIREIYMTPENGFLYLVHGGGYSKELDILEPDQLTEDMLPYPGEYLDYQKDVSDWNEHDIIEAADKDDCAVIETVF